MGYQKKKSSLHLIKRLSLGLQKAGLGFKVEQGALNVVRSIKKETKIEINTFLSKSVNQVKPYVGLLSKKVGSTTYRIPVSISLEKEVSVGLYWIVDASCGRKKGCFKEGIHNELVNLVSGLGGASSKKKVVLHKLAEENRVYLKFLV